jgi:hypothetical protein
VSDLKPCPFCLSEASYDENEFSVTCKNCGAYVLGMSDAIIELWNNRPVEQKFRKVVEASNKFLDMGSHSGFCSGQYMDYCNCGYSDLLKALKELEDRNE